MRLAQMMLLGSVQLLAACAPDLHEPAPLIGPASASAVPYGGGHVAAPSDGYVPPSAPYASPNSQVLAPGVGLGVYQPGWVRQERNRRGEDLRREREAREGINRGLQRQEYEGREQDHRRYEGTLGRY